MTQTKIIIPITLLMVSTAVLIPLLAKKPLEVLPNASDSKIESPIKSQFGVASYYDYILDSGWSSLGHRVCATRDWERYSYIKVTNIDNGLSVVCKVTDYGPDESIFPERIVDLSSFAFSQIAELKLGIINIKIENY